MYSLYFKTKLKLSVRTLVQIGILRCLFILILLLFVWWNLLLLPAPVSLLSYTFFLASYHGMRRDKKFLKITFPQSNRLYIAEYLIIALLFFPICILTKNYIYPLFYVCIAGAAPFIFDIKINTIRLGFPFFVKGSYEYIRGFRSFGLFIPALQLIAGIAVFHDNERLFLFSAILSGIICAYFQVFQENQFFLLNFKTFQRFIFLKCMHIIINTVLLYIPFIALSFVSPNVSAPVTLQILACSLLLALSFNMMRHCFLNQYFLNQILNIGMLFLFVLSFFIPELTIVFILIDLSLVFIVRERLRYLFI